jgi:hypothetical protein
LDAIAMMLSSALDRYEFAMADLLASWPDTLSYTDVSSGMDDIRGYSSALPATAVAFVMLLIAHAELIQFLWSPGDDPAQADEVRATHAAALKRLRAQTLRTLAPASRRA